MIIPLDALALLSLGLILLLAGGHYLIPGTMAIAHKMRLSPALVATILIAGGTSAPELIVSIDAALIGRTDLIWGNIIGSNITNIFLVLGISVLVTPILMTDKMVQRDGKILLVLTAALMGFAVLADALPRWASILLLIFLAYYIWQAIRKDEIPMDEAEDGAALPFWKGASYGIGGIIGLLIGADLIVDNAVIIALQAGISEAVIGLTIIAIGTSLPEIAAAVAGMMRGRADVALANVLGSNIFNIAAVMGVAGLFGSMPAPAGINSFALPVLAVATLLLSILIITKTPLNRRWGIVFIAFFVMFLAGNISL